MFQEERLFLDQITEETLDIQQVISLCLVSKQQTHSIHAYFVPAVLQEYFEINTEVSIDFLFPFFFPYLQYFRFSTA